MQKQERGVKMLCMKRQKKTGMKMGQEDWQKKPIYEKEKLEEQIGQTLNCRLDDISSLGGVLEERRWVNSNLVMLIPQNFS